MLTEPIRELIAEVKSSSAQEKHHGGAGLEISGIVSAAAGVYEKIRYLVDYREEHTIRRAAIERILKRHVLIEQRLVDGATLLKELVESQYLPEEHVSDVAIEKVDTTLKRFLELQYLSGRKRETAQVLLSLAATEVESHLSQHEYAIDHASVQALFKIVRPNIVLEGYSTEQIDVQVFCACRRALLSSDDAALMYALWLMFVPGWLDREDSLKDLAARLSPIISGMHHAVLHPVQWQIAQRIKNESICFRIIREILMKHANHADAILSDRKKLEEFTHHFLEEKYEKENERIKSSGIRAVIYLFITKMASAIAIEVPYESLVLGSIHYFPLAINIFFHPILLFALTRRVRSLGEHNTVLIIKGLHDILYDGKGRTVRVYARYTEFTKFFGFFYAVLFLGVFGAIITTLQFLGFSSVGTLLFLFFLALVSYFAYRIRSNTRRWRMTGNETTIVLVANVLAVPVIRAGRWLSQTFKSINIFVMIMDFLIETPFKLILNFSHQFILYLKEKADEVY